MDAHKLVSGATLGVPKILSIDANANDGVVGFE